MAFISFTPAQPVRPDPLSARVCIKAGWKERSAVFVIGSVAYSAIEILWRGYTHWTMSVTGGICFSILYAVNTSCPTRRLWKKCVIGSATITTIEFAVGCIVNLWLKWNVWDYSQRPLNLLGQICALYTILWYFLSIPIAGLSSLLQKRVFHH